MKQYKKNTTRPEFLETLIRKSSTDLSYESLTLFLTEITHLCYCAYTVLEEFDISKDDVTFAVADSESIVIKLASKDLTKQVDKAKVKMNVRYGHKHYLTKTSVRDGYISITAEFAHSEIADDDEE